MVESSMAGLMTGSRPSLWRAPSLGNAASDAYHESAIGRVLLGECYLSNLSIQVPVQMVDVAKAGGWRDLATHEAQVSTGRRGDGASGGRRRPQRTQHGHNTDTADMQTLAGH
jgi:hypothetical protein